MEHSREEQPRLVLQVSSYGPPHLGGLEGAAEMLFRHLPNHQWKVAWAFCDLTGGGSHDGEHRLAAVDLLERLTGIPVPIPTIASIRRLWSLVREADCVLIHDAMYLTSAFAALAALRHQKPFVLLVHVWKIPYRSPLATIAQDCARWILGRLCLRRAKAVITYNKSILVHLTRKASASKCHFIPNGVHDAFRQSAGASKSSSGRRQIVFAGRFVEKKGLHLVRQAAERFQQADFLICGDGPIDPRSWQLPNVHVMIANRDQLRVIFERSDLLLLPSRGEGFPLVIQESMRCGLLCAVFRETWEAWGRDADLFLLLENDNWLQQIEKFLSIAPVESTRGGIRDYAIKHWDWEKTAGSYRQILADAINPPRHVIRPFAQANVETSLCHG